ncbi:MAG: hypothetical protein J5546_09760 [Lachnospiraceae bacterium]|nr:hypothetical protein [Lachnospiraceae bacterium]
MPGTDTPRLFPDVFRNKRIIVCGDFLQLGLDKRSLHISSKEVNDWLNEKVRNYDWKNSKQNFAVVTFEEMLQEMRQLRKILDE